MSKIINYIKNPKSILIYLMNKNCFFLLPDKVYLKWKFKLIVGYKLDLKNPKTFSEKLQWLKLNNKNPDYTRMVDKYGAREYIKEKVGEEYLVPLIGVYDNFNDIDFEKLPNQFVIKCTHDSGGLVICKDKSSFDIKKAKKKINKFMKRNYYKVHREWPYKNVKHRIVIEEYIMNKDMSDLMEYNIFCFNGVPKFVSLCYGDKDKNRFNDFYDSSFNKLETKCIYNSSDNVFEKPKQFNEMKKIAEILSKNIPHLRVDFYLCDDKIYLGELTFYHFAGFTKFTPHKYEILFGSYLNIKEKNNEK